MKSSLLLALAFGAGSALALPGRLSRRDSCQIQLASSNGGRKIAIVIDSSGSMTWNDPDNLRLIAGKSLNDQLIPASAAGNGKSADLVTVITFNDTASVLYPLGDPSGADPAFGEIGADGGTWIADGVKSALAELTTPGSGTTADRSGILVLTDGEDSDTADLIDEIQQAGNASVRVSFGFLAAPDTFFEPDLLQAILRTGGTYGSFETADTIQSFLYQVLSNGLTAQDAVANSTGMKLLPGVTTAHLSGSQPADFVYVAQASEQLLFSIQSLSSQVLTAELTDAATGASLGKNTSDSSNDAFTVAYAAAAAGELRLQVTSGDPAEGVFQVSLNSSLGVSGCNLTTLPPASSTGGNNSTTNTTSGAGSTGTSGAGSGSGSGNNATVTKPTPTPSATQSIVPVGASAASKLGVGAGVPLLLFLVAAILL